MSSGKIVKILRSFYLIGNRVVFGKWDLRVERFGYGILIVIGFTYSKVGSDFFR